MPPIKNWGSTVALVGSSLFIHAATFYSFERLALYSEVRMAQETLLTQRLENEKLQFEFVEAPAKTHSREPSSKTKKISNRNAVNQDLEKDKTLAASQAGPKINQEGRADQLSQTKGAPAPPLEERPEIKPEEESKKALEEKPKEEEPKKISQNPDEIHEVIEKKEEKKEDAQDKSKSDEKSEAPQKASPSVAGLTGQDKITTQAMTRSKSMGAQLYGLTSFEATGSGMGEYMKNLKEKIWLQWFPYISFKYPNDFHSADALIRIVLNPEGEVKILRVIESNGSSVFASFCMEAIQRASGFGKVPSDILALVGKDELEITFGFHYH